MPAGGGVDESFKMFSRRNVGLCHNGFGDMNQNEREKIG